MSRGFKGLSYLVYYTAVSDISECHEDLKGLSHLVNYTAVSDINECHKGLKELSHLVYYTAVSDISECHEGLKGSVTWCITLLFQTSVSVTRI